MKSLPAMLRRVPPAWWLVLIGPVLLIDFPALPFVNDGHCDPWYLFGLYHDLPAYVEKLSWTRQAGRLPLNLPGYLLAQIFSGDVADYALFLLIYTCSAIFLYKAASALLSTREAVLTTLFFSLSPFVVANEGWTLFAPAIAYEIIALFCVARAVVASDVRKRLGWMFMSGVGWGAALDSHLATLVYGTFSYFLFALCVLLEVKSPLGARIKLIALSALSVVVAVAVFTAAMGLIGIIFFHAPYSMVLEQVFWVPGVMKRAANEFWIPEWYLHGPKLGAYLLGLLISAIAVGSYGRRMVLKSELTSSQCRRMAIAGSFLLTFSCLLINDFLLNGVFLQYEYYFVMLWPFLALAIFAIEFDWDLIPFPVPLLFFALCIVGLSLGNQFTPPEPTQTIATLAIALVAGALALAFLNTRRRVVRASIACVFAGVIAATTSISRTQQVGYQIWWPRQQGEALAVSYQRIHLGLDFVSQLLDARPALAFPKFWTDEVDTPDGLAFARSYFACGFQRFPRIDPTYSSSWATFSPGDTVVVVARGPNLRQRMIDAFDKIKLVPKILGRMTMEDPKGSYQIVVTTVTAKGENVPQPQ